MEELYRLGISENTIKTMMDINPNINEITDTEVLIKEKLLNMVGCKESEIINIISSNALYLDRTNDEILKLIKFLEKLGFKSLNILFDSNPYILNLEPFEIEDYINKRMEKNETLKDIISDLDSNPFLFNEM